jgi:hypothetical protein
MHGAHLGGGIWIVHFFGTQRYRSGCPVRDHRSFICPTQTTPPRLSNRLRTEAAEDRFSRLVITNR